MVSSYMLDHTFTGRLANALLYSVSICPIFNAYALTSIPAAVHLPQMAIYRATCLVHSLYIISRVSFLVK